MNKPLTDERIASFHEAGHACTCVALRVPFRKVDIISNGDRDGRVYNRKRHAAFPDDHDPRVIDLVERAIIVDFAGGIAQRRYAPRSDWAFGMGHDGLEHDFYYDEDDDLVCSTSDRITSGSDLYNIDARLRMLERDGDAAYRAELEARAKALVARLWPEIKIVAAALLKHKTLSQAQVRRLMNRAAARPANKK
jgi:hypothetical protein